MTLIHVFPGQGSQRVGMGAALFDEFRDLVDDIDDVLGWSIRSLCLADPDSRLHQTAYTQPAVYVVNGLSYLARRRRGPAPDVAAGHSLGEYSALFAAGAFDFLTGLRLVKKRGEVMARCAGGAMAAVVGLSASAVAEVLTRYDLGGIDIANLNSIDQIVVSGPGAELAAAEAPLRAAGAWQFVVLRVSGASHSRYMVDAAREFADFLRGFRFAPLQFPVISNVDAGPYRDDHIHETLTLHMTHPVRWTETVRFLLAFADPHFDEVGVGNVLSGLIRRIRARAVPFPVLDEPTERGAADVESQAISCSR